MREPANQKTNWRLIGVALMLGLLSLIGAKLFILKNDTTFSQQDWMGTWEIIYYYEHSDTLAYTGTIKISQTDSLRAILTIFPPKSSRSEEPIIRELAIAENAASLTGYLIHDRYKINGGYLQEYFELNLIDLHQFQGKGWCQAYCAEGTEQQEIVWSGKKIE